jgi:hypothetical protein
MIICEASTVKAYWPRDVAIPKWFLEFTTGKRPLDKQHLAH